MEEITPTFAFEEDKVFAIVAGRVIADGSSVAEVEEAAERHVEALKAEKAQQEADDTKKNATHIITPNGLKGELLGRVSTWQGGDQVTARFANGQTATFIVSDEDKVKYIKETAPTKTSGLVEDLQIRLNADYEKDKDSLATRLEELKAIGAEASRLITKGSSYIHEVELDNVKIAAEHEAAGVQTALDYLESADAEAIQAPAPFESGVVEQASMGRGASDNWLDVTAQEMVKESEETDYEKFINEGPAMFVTNLELGTLADVGSTREMAQEHVTAHTAGFEGDDVDEYRTLFVSRVEVARRNELAERKQKTAKVATEQKEEFDNSPDEALFL